MFANISVKDALKLAYEGKALLFDIRTPEAYKKGHLPMAYYGEEKEIKKAAAEKSEKMIILYCDYGSQSMRMAKMLAEAGYSNMASVVGGYRAYEGYVEIEKRSLWTMEWKERGS